MPLFQQNFVPTYLIRVYAPNSAGQTTRSYVIPPASNRDQVDLQQDIFTLPRQEAATRLNEHFRCSLLFAIQYGLYKHRGNHFVKPDLSKISLLLLDTRDVPEGTFIKDLEIMETFSAYSDPKVKKNLKDLVDFRRDNRGYYFGEYLTQGDVDIEGKCVVTNMQRLIDTGLFELIPNFRDESKWTVWSNRVLQLRKPFNTPQDARTTIHAEVRNAMAIAVACFGGRWVFPVATMLLALEPRKKKDPVIVKDEIEQLQLNKIKTDDDYKLSEVKQFQSLIDDTFQRVTGGEVDRLNTKKQKADPSATSKDVANDSLMKRLGELGL
ncbi:MAG: hypothetical protein LQ349_003694 [Xanthoria aureola]|nr:MAG: hypothetical protein LQ349_003694 [Xanthoria aureola]